MQRSISRILICLLALPVVTVAKKLPPGATTLTKPTTRREKHFDINNDGFLNISERQLVRTQAHFNTPLVTKKKQLPYDVNKDRMLSADEWYLYARDRENSRLDEAYAKYKTKERAK